MDEVFVKFGIHAAFCMEFVIKWGISFILLMSVLLIYHIYAEIIFLVIYFCFHLWLCCFTINSSTLNIILYEPMKKVNKIIFCPFIGSPI